MRKILVVDDDEAIRRLVKARLSDIYEVIDTGNPEQALGFALEHKPDVILLDLMMPACSGFELCQSLHTLSYTSRIPIFVVTGESAEKYRDYVSSLGASGFFEKPINFPALRDRLAKELQTQRPERRSHVRLRMKFALKLKGTDESGASFQHLTTTENVSAGGFFCGFPVVLSHETIVEVLLAGSVQDRFVGRARAVRKEAPDVMWPRYGFQFIERSSEWILQG
jgi:response regulator RpfG family c-di-GMP phosphodiesterase